MTERKSWSLWQAVLVTSTVIAILLLTPIAIGMVAGYLGVRSKPKTVEVIRRVTVPASAGAASAHAARSP